MADISKEQQDAILFIEFLEAAYKLGRNAGLDAAKQLFPQPHQEYFGREAQDAIESLKDNTP